MSEKIRKRVVRKQAAPLTGNLVVDVIDHRQKHHFLAGPEPVEHVDQAMFEAALPGTKAGQIIQVMTEGFLLHDRLLRPAQVGVSSNTQG